MQAFSDTASLIQVSKAQIQGVCLRLLPMMPINHAVGSRSTCRRRLKFLTYGQIIPHTRILGHAYRIMGISSILVLIKVRKYGKRRIKMGKCDLKTQQAAIVD